MQQAAVRIDREIGGTNAQMPEFTQSVEQPKTSEQPTTKAPTEPKFEPYKGKIRKSGTGCVTMINDHLFEGRFTPTNADGSDAAERAYQKYRSQAVRCYHNRSVHRIYGDRQTCLRCALDHRYYRRSIAQRGTCDDVRCFR